VLEDIQVEMIRIDKRRYSLIKPKEVFIDGEVFKFKNSAKKNNFTGN